MNGGVSRPRCHRRRLSWGISALLLLAGCPATVFCTDTGLHPWFRDGIEQYPAPVPQSRLEPAADVAPEARIAALFAQPAAARVAANTGVSMRVTGMRFEREYAGKSVPEGQLFLVLDTEWRNLQAPEWVRRSSLEGKADRSMGAGGLAAGSRSDADATTLADFGYKVPKLADHLFAIADGYAVDLAGGSIAPDQPLQIARYGETITLRLAFRVAESATSLALQFFDYRQGHITLPLAGDPEPVVPEALERIAGALELNATLVDRGEQVGEQALPEGWRFAEVLLSGRSLAESGGIGSILEVHTFSDTWIKVDGGYLVAPVPGSDHNPALLRFTPAYFQQRRLLFALPAASPNHRLGLRLGKHVLKIDLSEQAPSGPPEALASQEDGSAMTVQVYGLRHGDGGDVLDLGVKPRAAGKGLEIDIGRQFAMVAAGERVAPDIEATAALAFGAAPRLIVPPETPVRFELAFPARAPQALALRGFAGEVQIPLADLAIADSTPLLVGTPLARGITAAPAVESAELPTAAAPGAVAAATVTAPTPTVAERAGPALRPPPPPVRLPPLQTAGLPREAEPNDSFEEAMELRDSHAVSGFLKKGDRDFVTFVLDGEPQLWAIEVTGAGVGEFSYYENSGQYTLRRNVPRDAQALASMTHLHLLPGRHTVGLVGRGEAEAEYALRMAPLGPPDLSVEREPNDAQDQASLLPVGALRYGWIYDDNDRDHYRFSVQMESRLRITVTPPAQERIDAQIYRQADFDSPEPGQPAVYEGVFVPGDYLLQIKLRSNGTSSEPYALQTERLNPFGESDDPDLALEFSAEPPVPAAFHPQSQRFSVPLRIANKSAAERDLRLSARSSHWSWQPRLPREVITLGAGESKEIPVELLVQPDAWEGYPVQLAVAASTDAGTQAVAQLDLAPACEASALSPLPGRPLPDELLGGFNLAATALGGEPVGTDAARQGMLYDGITPNNQVWSVGVSANDFPYELTVKLAGDGSLPLTGVLLNPQGNCEQKQMIKDFEVLLSVDGEQFETVTSGRLETAPFEQAWVFEQPITARYARLRVKSNYGDNRGRLCLGEFKVVADPASSPFEGQDLNVGLARLGGHVVWSDPLISEGNSRDLLTEETEQPGWKADHLNRNAFVVALHHNRAALLRELQWVGVQGTNQKQLSWVNVSISTESPLGPWAALGRWELESDPAVTSAFRLDPPVWARFVRISTSEPDRSTYYYLPETLRLIEAEHGANYNSVLGEWGHYAKAAYYEQQRNAMEGKTAALQNPPEGGNQAMLMMPGQTYSSAVARGEREQYYRIRVPASDNTLELSLQNGDAQRLDVELDEEESARPVPVSRGQTETGAARFVASVEGGATYVLRVAEAERYIVVAWDNSGSVSPYKHLLYQSLAEFVTNVAPGIEYVNFVPFQEPPASLLTDQWMDQPLALQSLLNNYDRKDASSNTEANVLSAALELGQREGSRAIVVLTDAETTGYVGRAGMWAALDEAQPRVFTLELHSGNAKEVPSQQDVMQDLASVNVGHYAWFSSQADLDLGFRRASCMLRRPVEYAMALETRNEAPPQPGAIEVAATRSVAAGGAVEIIFDASGSMYKRVDGVPRIDIARQVLTDLVQNTLPDSATVALRVFGNREAQSCRTDLEIVPGPLNRQAVIDVLAGIRPQDRSRTPLADSLLQVEKDLAKIDGTKLIVMLTDGEESCDGDPDAAIAQLREKGLDVRLNIVGFAIEDESLKKTFARWADSGGGRYFNADSADQLGAALGDALLPKFQVLDESDAVVAVGTAGSVAVEVPVGSYRVRVLTDPPVEYGDVRVQGNQTTRLALQD